MGALAVLVACGGGGDGGSAGEGGTGGSAGAGGSGGSGPTCDLCVRANGVQPTLACPDDVGMGGFGGAGGAAGVGGADWTGECKTHVDCDDDGDPCSSPCLLGMCSREPLEDGRLCCPDASGDCEVLHICGRGTCRETCSCATDCQRTFNDCIATVCRHDNSSYTWGYCDELLVEDETPCAGGVCEAGVCELTSTRLPCTEQGVSNAILQGGGPFTFACDGPTELAPQILSFDIERDLVLDGEGNLALTLTSFSIAENAAVELRGMTLRRRISNRGTLTLVNVEVRGGIFNAGVVTATNVAVSVGDRGISNTGTFTATDVEVFGNSVGVLNSGTFIGTRVAVSNNVGTRPLGHGIGIRHHAGAMVLTNCTISQNTVSDPENLLFHSAVLNLSDMTLAHCTVVGDGTDMRSINNRGELRMASTLVESGCSNGSQIIDSQGYNIESPGDTCRLGSPTDQISVSAEALDLGPLQYNGGPAKTHALGAASVAIDLVPVAACLDADGEPLTSDQRGAPRPGGAMCDVGAFEAQP